MTATRRDEARGLGGLRGEAADVGHVEPNSAPLGSYRQAPAFQEYAATMLSTIDFRVLTLAQRGLLYTLRLECWVNGRVPADPEVLARVIGFDAAETRDILRALVPSFFEQIDGELICPELDEYRQRLEEKRARQSAGGRLGAEKTNRRPKRQGSGKPTGNSSAKSSVQSSAYSSTTPPGSGRVLSTAQHSPANGEAITTEREGGTF